MAKKKYSDELKLEIVQAYLLGRKSYREVAEKYFVCISDVKKWAAAYDENGVEGLTAKHGTYSGTFKVSVVEYMRNTGCSARRAAAHFKIPSHPTITKWERIYLEEGPDALCEERRGRNGNMNKGKPKKPRLEKQTEEDLIAEVQRLRMENEYLKKLNALVQERENQRTRQSNSCR